MNLRTNITDLLQYVILDGSDALKLTIRSCY